MSQPSKGTSVLPAAAGLISKRYRNSGVCRTAVITAWTPELKMPPVVRPTCQIACRICVWLASTGRRNALLPNDVMNVCAHCCSPAVTGSQVRTRDRRFATVSAEIASAAVRYSLASSGGVSWAAALFRNGSSSVVASTAKFRLRLDTSPSRSDTVFRYSALLRRRSGVGFTSEATLLQATVPLGGVDPGGWLAAPPALPELPAAPLGPVDPLDAAPSGRDDGSPLPLISPVQPSVSARHIAAAVEICRRVFIATLQFSERR